MTIPTPPAEPILRADDIAAWDAWMRAARVHATTQAHRRRVEAARVACIEAVEWSDRLPPGVTPEAAPGTAPWPRPNRPGVSCSGGKDSTAMTALVCLDAGLAGHVEIVSEKDDLDFPGEREYVEALASRCGAPLRIVTPTVSPAAYIAEAAARGELHCAADIHSRVAGLSKECFYALMERDNHTRPLVFLGIRSAESGVRKMVVNAARGKRRRANDTLSAGPWGGLPGAPTRGTAYPQSGVTYWHAGAFQWRCVPVGHFTDLDVYAYLDTRGIDPLPVYRCVGLMHRDCPGRVRKSWWLPGGQTARGQVAWLRRYYPSLYRTLCGWMPDASLHR